MQSCIYEGTVRHRRFEPVRHEFRSTLFMMYLDLAELPTVFAKRWFWSVERPNLASFYRSDHVSGSHLALDESIRDLVELRTSSRPVGPIRLLTHLRYFGYCFNPLSVYFCFNEIGNQLHSVVAEVTNTPWGERHYYVLLADSNRTPISPPSEVADQPGMQKHVFRFAKDFHVSPFMGMDFEYRWCLSGPANALVLHTENLDRDHVCFDATLSLKRRQINRWTLARMLICYPLITAQVIANIHWQALLLWWKNIPYVPHPKTGRSSEPLKNTVAQTTDHATRLK